VTGRPDTRWLGQGNCLGVNPDLFYPGVGEPTDEAKAVCAGCVVRDRCLEHALATGEKHGIWGGTSENERRRIRRERRGAALAAREAS
jgi:WhiB family redox-sensing transcriptional regulator